MDCAIADDSVIEVGSTGVTGFMNPIVRTRVFCFIQSCTAAAKDQVVAKQHNRWMCAKVWIVWKSSTRFMPPLGCIDSSDEEGPVALPLDIDMFDNAFGTDSDAGEGVNQG